jgi:hypothetical protein
VNSVLTTLIITTHFKFYHINSVHEDTCHSLLGSSPSLSMSAVAA